VKSSTSYRPRIACLAAIGFAILVMSCSSSNLQSVSGKVLHKGQPIKGAVVTLHPKGGENDAKAQRPSGVTDDQGTFTLATGKDTGVAPGDYIVTIIWLQQPPAPKKPRGTEPPPDATDQFQGRYADAKNSKLSVTIKSGMKELEPFNLD